MAARNYEIIKNLLDTVVFGEHTIGYLVSMAGIALAFLIGARFITGVFKKAENRPHVQNVNCISCGWCGKVSIYAGRCPQCNQPVREREAQAQRPYGL
jgi:hypothetical protein